MTETNDTLGLSRRKILGSIGAIGVASVGAGLGTSAYFSDRESFEGNTLTAGELQLYGSWQQLYYGADQSVRPQDYGAAGRPWVNAYPDDTDNGIQSLGDLTYVDDPSDDPADGRNIPLSCGDFESLGDAPRPAISLADVKPGDEGEVTFGFTLCDNPGYVWMNGTVTEQTPGAGEGQLADYLRGKIWRDEDCDNVYDDLEPSDLVLMVDFSGSMLYSQYGGVVSSDEITVGDNEYGETTYPTTTKIDLVEQGLIEFIDLLQTEIDGDSDIDADDFRVGAVFFDGYSNDGNSSNPGANVVTSADVPDWGDPDGDGFTSDITDLVTLDSDGEAPLRNLRDKLDDLFDGTGTALEEGFGELIDLFDERVDGSRKPQSITFTDGEPYFGGSLTNDRFEELLVAANAARTDPDYATSIFIVGDDTGDSRAEFTQRVMAGPAGLPIDVSGATAATFSGDPFTYGGDPAFFFNIDDPASIPDLFAQVALEILPEEVIACGTLADVLAVLESDPGRIVDAVPRADGIDCFEPGRTYCVGFSWSFPIRSNDHEATMDNNDVQGASVEFDLGLYTEQCRHNFVAES
ncbi:SipW-dependent-type signal peptide-containing protein [Natronorubrum sp. A-ect3]|uniref:SipW-dependent-type signal peptide-containing protein n=1 Tax=Natronorubrum sp. A-ect3 TaxID=3242698 RepID=UPI00359E0E6F